MWTTIFMAKVTYPMTYNGGPSNYEAFIIIIPKMLQLSILEMFIFSALTHFCYSSGLQIRHVA